MRDLDPIKFREELRATMARFISTAAPVSEIRAPRLAQQIAEALRSDRVSLVKGPYVESLPDFEKGPSLSDLVERGILDPQWKALDQSSLKHRRLSARNETFGAECRQSARNRTFTRGSAKVRVVPGADMRRCRERA